MNPLIQRSWSQTLPENPTSDPTDGKIRLFAAIEVPVEVKTRINELMANLQKGIQFTGAHPKWVQPATIHITLVFIGWSERQDVDRLATACELATESLETFRLGIGDLHLFPDDKNPHVLALGFQKSTRELIHLQSDLMKKMQLQGFSLEERAYRPHLTLARISSRKGLPGLRDLVKSHSRFQAGLFEVNEIVLFQSILERTGAKHIPLHRFALKASA